MDFQQTNLPDRQMFREAFAAGWARYLSRFAHTALASEQYMRGPVAMARLIFEYGGEEREVAAAACLAGPAVFCGEPDGLLCEELLAFSREIGTVGETHSRDLYGKISGLSADARLMLQASAIMLLEQIVGSKGEPPEECMKAYTGALELYSAARGAHDFFNLDTRFEIAAMKVTTVLEEGHIWSRPRGMTARVHA